MTHPAMLEQWSPTRSSAVSRSDQTNPDSMRIHHILRMQQGSCSIESGFVWSDLLTALERVGDHCSNIAGCVIDLHHHNMNTHEAIRSARMENENFDDEYKAYAVKYSLK